MDSEQNYKKRIGVIGAGISGLTAACHLGNSGYDVTVIETQSRVGGRAVTIRDVFPKHLVAQAGPSRFPGDFKRVREYARKFGLELRPFYPKKGRVIAYLHGKMIEEYRPNGEEFWGYTALIRRYPTMIERVLLRFGVSVLQIYRKILGQPTWMTFRFLEGTDRLTDALASSTKALFLLETTVTSITQEENFVRLTLSSQNGVSSSDFDYVVCAVPLTILNDLKFTPPLPSAKNKLAKEIPFHSAIRVFLQMKSAYWRKHGQNGFAVTDTIGEIWDPDFDISDSPAMLVCYLKDDLADKVSDLDEKDLINYTLKELEKIFPGAKDNFEQAATFNWKKQPWIRGGWPKVRPFSSRIGEFRKPFGRVYFAGDYTAELKFLNMMEGAIESGEHVAKLISKIE